MTKSKFLYRDNSKFLRLLSQYYKAKGKVDSTLNHICDFSQQFAEQFKRDFESKMLKTLRRIQ
jgi:hypothetical protein